MKLNLYLIDNAQKLWYNERKMGKRSKTGRKTTMAEIIHHGGRPAISVNGEIYPPMMATIRTMEEGKRILFDEEYFAALGKSGIRIFFLLCDTIWRKPNALELFKIEAESLLKAVPDALIVVRMGLHPTNEWILAHPEECIEYSDGERPGVHLFSESFEDDLPMHYSLCSDKWREDAGKALAETWKLLMELPYADRIIGCFLAAGGTSEWYYMLEVVDEKNKRVLDHSESFRRHFSRYLTERYGTDEALQKAWKNPAATLENPPIPDYEAHYFASRVDYDCAFPPMRMYTNKPVPPPPSNGTSVGAFADLDKHMDVYDFYRAWNIGSAESVLHFAKILKNETPDKLVGAFYGSQGCTEYLSAGTTAGTVKVLESPYIDFLAAPGVYENRQPGGQEGQREVQDSFALHNKIYIVEQDTRTLKENRYFMNCAEIFDMTDTINVMKREFGRNISEDVQAWWFDQLLGRPRYKYPEIYKLIECQQKIAKDAYSLDRTKKNEIAFIFDEDSICAASRQTFRDTVEDMRNYQIHRIGASADQYYHNDIDLETMPSYKMYVFFNTYALTKAERETIKKKLKKDGAVAVFLHGSGFIDPSPDAEPHNSVSHMEDLTGISFGLEDHYFDPNFRWNGESHPISERLDKREIFGVFSRQRHEMLARRRIDGYSKFPPYLYPMLYAKDEKATHLSYFLTSGFPAVSVKEMDGYTSVYYGSKSISSATLRELARFAGCHIYTESDEVIYPGKNFVTFHADHTGTKKIRFPRPVSVFEVYEEKYYGKDVTEIEFEAYLGETKMFKVTEN